MLLSISMNAFEWVLNRIFMLRYLAVLIIVNAFGKK